MLMLRKNKFYVEGGNKPYFTLTENEKVGEEWTSKEVASFWLKTDKAGNKYYSGAYAKPKETEQTGADKAYNAMD